MKIGKIIANIQNKFNSFGQGKAPSLSSFGVASQNNVTNDITFEGKRGLVKSDYFQDHKVEYVRGTTGALEPRYYVAGPDYCCASVHVNGNEHYGARKHSHDAAMIDAIESSPYFRPHARIEETGSVNGRDFSDHSATVVKRIYFLDPGEHISKREKSKYSFIVHPY